MQTKLITFFVICFFLTSSASAMPKDYDSNTLSTLNEIYWLYDNSAIWYRKHSGFYQIKDFIDTTLLTAPEADILTLKPQDLTTLMLVFQSEQNPITIQFNEKILKYQNTWYAIDKETVHKLQAMNNYRVSKGDLVHASLVKKLRKGTSIN